MATNETGPKLCRRCNENHVTHTMRSEPTCGPCYFDYVQMKAVKRLEAAAKEIGAAPMQTKKVLVGLSFGPSSSSLVNILDESISNQLKKRPKPAYDPVVMHVDTDLFLSSSSSSSSSSTWAQSSPAQSLLDRFSDRYPRFHFRTVPLACVLDLEAIDWGVLPVPATRDPDAGATTTPAARLRGFFGHLPSSTSRADVLRLLVRHALVSAAARESCHALLLGSSTTALAALTLAEAAKGRGYALPRIINDGFQSTHAVEKTAYQGQGLGEAAEKTSADPRNVPVYYPLREIFRSELATYATLVSPPLVQLLSVSDASKPAGAIVSHKDVSIDDLMARYFEDVAQNYPSIVANVVRTVAKLKRTGDDEQNTSCGLCGMGLDKSGDERWKGEIGEDGGGSGYASLCYGCQRAMRT